MDQFKCHYFNIKIVIVSLINKELIKKLHIPNQSIEVIIDDKVFYCDKVNLFYYGNCFEFIGVDYLFIYHIKHWLEKLNNTGVTTLKPNKDIFVKYENKHIKIILHDTLPKELSVEGNTLKISFSYYSVEYCNK